MKSKHAADSCVLVKFFPRELYKNAIIEKISSQFGKAVRLESCFPLSL